MNAAVLDMPAAPRAGSAFDAKWLVIGGAVALIAWLALVPLGFLLWESVLTPEAAGRAQEFTLENYITAYTGAETIKLSAEVLDRIDALVAPGRTVMPDEAKWETPDLSRRARRI